MTSTLSPIAGHVVFDANNDGTFGDNVKTLVNGTFDIAAKDNTAESVTITATDGSGKTGTSSTYTISPAALHTVTIVQQPTDTVAGQDISPAVTVQATDEYGKSSPVRVLACR